MKTAAIVALLAGVASAFAPSQQSATRTSLQAFEDEIGAQEPLGFWDPLNFVYEQDQARFDRLRYVELKHGRISMLAVLGHLVTTSGYRLPGAIDKAGTEFASIKTGIAGLSQIPTNGLAQIVLFIGFLELFVMKDVNGEAEFMGDFRNGFAPGWKNLSEAEKTQKRAIELNNGR